MNQEVEVKAGEFEESSTIENSNEPKSQSFDLSRLRLSQNFAEKVGVKKALLTVPVRKPGRQEFIRVHPGEDMVIQTAVIELKEDHETYLVEPNLWSEMPSELAPKALFTTINRQGVLTLWPVRLPGEDGRHDEWSRSALEAVEIAKTRWIRIVANMALQAYEVFEATGNLPDPKWPEISFQRILEIAFKDRFIRTLDHPVVRRLKGGA